MFHKLRGNTILLVQSNSGETLLLANILHNNLLPEFDHIYFTSSYQKEIFDMYLRNYTYSYINNRALHRPIKSEYSLNDKHVMCFLGNDFWLEYFLPDKHIKEAALEFLNIDKSIFKYSQPHIPAEEISRVKNKLSALGIDVNNFIFINSSTSSMTDFPPGEFTRLCRELREYGYGILINNAESKKIFSFKEIIISAGLTKQIISLRSGLTEILCLYDIPIHAIYTKGSIENFNEHYSLLKYGFNNPYVIEYNYDETTTDLILQNVRGIKDAGY